MSSKLGIRIKFFRKRAKFSQMDLEIASGLSNGVISRIENGEINPTKETIHNICKVLELGRDEIDYLIGKLSDPATADEIEKAKIEAAEFMKRRGNLAYLLDDRWRFYMVSDTFYRLLKIQDEELNFVIGKTTAEIIVRNDSPVLNRLDKTRYINLLQTYLPYYFSYMSHMDDDPIYRHTVDEILKNPISKEIWSNTSYEKAKKYATQDDRVIDFDVFGMKFPLYYAMQPLGKNNRFFIVEYTTKNALLNLIPQLI